MVGEDNPAPRLSRIVERLVRAAARNGSPQRPRLDAIAATLGRSRTPKIASFPISGPCAEALSERKAEAGDRELLYAESGDGRWLHVHADRYLVSWVVGELIDDSIRRAEGWSRVALLSEPVSGAIRLTVRDDGRRPRGARTRASIGLRVGEWIVAAQGGTLESSWFAGGGALHVLRLPHPADGPYGPARRPFRHSNRQAGAHTEGNSAPKDA